MLRYKTRFEPHRQQQAGEPQISSTESLAHLERLRKTAAQHKALIFVKNIRDLDRDLSDPTPYLPSPQRRL